MSPLVFVVHSLVIYVYLVLWFWSVFWNFGYVFLICLINLTVVLMFYMETKHVFLKVTF